ncbi:hypothetical protein BD311DRAFT_762650 [Dichomitus squalens]|uniref:Uncharacterized protein n=1 Tax=Dichomitus squalens TaxID=114155 RepID=A0A4Q9MG97_9APHY|nr:hypothetical protein BD311DRAFT_762650 [Dichomitus squalens]
MQRLTSRALLGRALSSRSISCLQHCGRQNIPQFEASQTFPNSPYLRQLTTRSHETNRGSLRLGSLKPPQTRHREVYTLDPTRLTAHDYVDLSTTLLPRVHFVSQSEGPSSAPSSPIRNSGILLYPRGLHDKTFPPNTSGFLYYHIPPYSPPIAGEVHFRVTPDADPASFAVGSDLLTEHGLLWRIPLLYTTIGDNYKGLHALLLQDGLVTQKLLETATAAAETIRNTDYRRHNTVGGHQTTILSSFRQKFIFRFGSYNGMFLVLGKDSIMRKHSRHIGEFYLPENVPRQYSPFKGSAICCFEPSPLPEHAGKRAVVLRILRPVDNDPIRPNEPSRGPTPVPHAALTPRNGQLLLTIRRRRIQPWSVYVDDVGKSEGDTKKSMGRMLRTLYENSELYGLPPEPFL